MSDCLNFSGKLTLQDVPQSFQDMDDSKLSIIQIRHAPGNLSETNAGTIAAGL
jgi:hypothetical protein